MSCIFPIANVLPICSPSSTFLQKPDCLKFLFKLGFPIYESGLSSHILKIFILHITLTPWFKVVISTLPLFPGPSTHLFEVFRLMLSYELRRPTHIKDLQSHGKSRGRRKHFGESWKSMSTWSLDVDYLLFCLFDLPIRPTCPALPGSNHVQLTHVEALASTPHLKQNSGQSLGHGYYRFLIAMPGADSAKVRIQRMSGIGRMVSRLVKQHAKFT